MLDMISEFLQRPLRSEKKKASRALMLKLSQSRS